jgi:hypothetical protein
MQMWCPCLNPSVKLHALHRSVVPVGVTVMLGLCNPPRWCRGEPAKPGLLYPRAIWPLPREPVGTSSPRASDERHPAVWQANPAITKYSKARTYQQDKLVYNPVQCCCIWKYLFMWIHMPINCPGSKRWSVSSSPWVLLWEGGWAWDKGERVVAPRRGKRGDGASWIDENLTGLKNKKKFTRLIQLVQMDSEDLKRWWVTFIF